MYTGPFCVPQVGLELSTQPKWPETQGSPPLSASGMYGSYMDHRPASPRLVTLRVYFNHSFVAGYLKLCLCFHDTMPHIHKALGTAHFFNAPALASACSEQDMKMFRKTTLLPRKAELLYVQCNAFQEQNCCTTKAPLKVKCAIFPYICVFVYWRNTKFYINICL